MPKTKLTKATVDKIPNPEKGQALHWDTELPGFGLLVGAKSKSYVAQKEVNGRSRRVTIGRHGVWAPDPARKEARRLLQEMDQGRDPVRERKKEQERRVTLRQAREKHDAKMRKQDRSAQSMAHYWWLAEKYMPDWLDRALVDLTQEDVERRHQRIGEKHGRYAANHAMQMLRAAWNMNPNLGPNPVQNLTMYATRERQTLIELDDLPVFAAALEQIENPIRADFYLLLLMTGLRRTDAATMRWEDVHLDKGYVHRPEPKGGKSFAFDLPLSDALVQLLQRRREGNEPFFPGSPWVFPANSRSGHLDEGKLSAKERERLPIAWHPHQLRHTYITHAENEAGAPTRHVRALTNHAVPKPKDAHDGYNHLHMRHLAATQQRISDWFVAHLWPQTADEKVTPLHGTYT